MGASTATTKYCTSVTLPMAVPSRVESSPTVLFVSVCTALVAVAASGTRMNAWTVRLVMVTLRRTSSVERAPKRNARCIRKLCALKNEAPPLPFPA
jgi:hypothetical protein